METGVLIVHSVVGALLLVLCGVAVSQPPPPAPAKARQEQKYDARKTEKDAKAPQNEAKNSPLPVTIDNPVTVQKSKQDRDAEADDIEHKASNERRLIIWTAALVGTTFLLAVITAFLARYTYKLWRDASDTSARQAEEMRQSLDIAGDLAAAAKEANRISAENMVASRRAWLSIEDVQLKHPTQFTEEGFVFGVNVTVKNFGQSPATSVDVSFESYFTESKVGAFPEAVARFKAGLRGHPVQLGLSLFPTETYTQGQIWHDEIEKIGVDIRTNPATGERQADFIIFIGVTYRIPGDAAAHITYRPYEMINVPIGTTIAPGQLVDLPHMPFIAGEVD